MSNAQDKRNWERLRDAVRGNLRLNVPLAPLTWFKTGGPCDALFTPADQDDLVDFLQNIPPQTLVTPLGAGSNLLVRDGGLDGVVIRLGSAFAQTSSEHNIIFAGAAAQGAKVAKTALKVSLGGLEFLSGIPGTLGGALRMNAGAYGQDTAGPLIWAEAVHRTGELKRFERDELVYSYRHCALSEDWIFTRACLRGQPDHPEAIAARMKDIQSSRATTQPIKSRTGGSTFKNPTDPKVGKAWELIDAAGCRGFSLGDACVSQQHCNFLINQGNATAAQLEKVGETVRQRVRDHSGMNLDWEIKRIGRAQNTEGGTLS